MNDEAEGTLGDRVFLVRKALGPNPRKPLAQEAFANLLAAQGIKVYGSALSLLEQNKRAVTLEEIAAIAAIDPKRRGKLWLAWGETVDSTMSQQMPVSSFQTEEQATGRKQDKKKRA